MKQKRHLLLMRAAMTLLLTMAGFTYASADRWVGNSAINVNGTWYYAGNDQMTWCTGGAFNDANLGIFGSTLRIGGQSQVYTDGSSWGQGTMTMGYKIDNGDVQEATLTWYKFENNNNLLQSGGSNFAAIDISGLSDGNHTIAVWFKSENVYDSNSGANYVASFTVDSSHPNIGTIQWNTTGDGFYEINAESDLEDLAVYVNGSGTYYAGGTETTAHDCADLTFKLTQNITMTGEHTPIGVYDFSNPKYFRGTFDGNGKDIKNLTINKPNNEHLGLFNTLGDGAVVKDLTLSDCKITAWGYAGAIVGYAWGDKDKDYSSNPHITIENCHVINCDIKATVAYKPGYSNSLGGIAGATLKTQLTDCTVTGSISTTVSNEGLGGIIGCANSDTYTTRCENAASVTGPGTYHGGIAGIVTGNMYHFTDCLNTGVVLGDDPELVAAITCRYYQYSNLISNCYYASPCTVSAFGEKYADSAGECERAYSITKGTQLSNLVITEDATVTSAIDSKKYYKAGTYTLTLTPIVPEGYSFVSYTCEGGTLTNLTTADGEHSLTVSNQDVTINAIISSNNGTDLSDATIANIPNQLWLGNVSLEPALTITLGNTTLVEGTDYIVEYTNNTVVGTATATVKGINNYKGTTSKTFTIFTFAGEGTQNNPYQITNEADLNALASIVNTGAENYYQKYLVQTDNITLTSEHIAIGASYSNSFKGTFNGKNGETQYVINGLVINKPKSEYQGLFGYIYDATIRNVTIVNCDITAGDYAGGVAGQLYDNRIENCKVSGAIKVADGNSASYHGGIVGYMRSGTVDKCLNTADVTGNGNNHGGIVGYTTYPISNCFNVGTVEGTSYVGSIAGYSSGTLTKNYHPLTATGGIGAYQKTTGVDRAGAEVAVKITAAEGVTLTLPETPTYFWNNENLYGSGTEVELNYTVPDGKFFNLYTVNSGEISNSGIQTGKHTLTGFAEDVIISGSTVDSQTDIADDVMITGIDAATFDGQQKAEPVITYNDETLVKNTHYTLTYTKGGETMTELKDAGTYTITINFLGIYTGTKVEQFVINPFNISDENAVTVTRIDAQYAKTNSVNHPVPTVTCAAINNVTLVSGTDYELSYSEGCIEPGDYAVTITGQGNYTGTKVIPFTIADVETMTLYDGHSSYSAVPIYGYRANYYYKCEMLMPTADLAAMKGKVITTMKFHADRDATGNWGDARFRMFMKEVTLTNFADPNNNFQGADGATIVYEGALDMKHGVINVTFDTPYLYQGGNLLIGVYQYEKGTSWSGYMIKGGGHASSSILGYNANSLDDVTPESPGAFLPKTTFWYATPTEISVKMNSVGIMTYASPYALDFNDVEGLTASYASAFISNGDDIGTLTLTTAGEVPASEGLLLKGTAGTTYTVPVIASAAALAPANLMVGLTAATSVSKKQTIGNEEYTSFILANGDNGINWYVLAEDSYTLKANSAYLRLKSSDVYTSDGSARQIVMDFSEASGISDALRLNDKGELRNEGWYTLDGVKLDKQPTRKGLYIKDGMKIVVK